MNTQNSDLRRVNFATKQIQLTQHVIKIASHRSLKIQIRSMKSTRTSPSQKLVKFVARISKASEIQLGATKRTGRSKSPHTSRSPSTARLPQKGLNPEVKYAVFTTRNPSTTVLATETPISGKLLNSALLSVEDIPYFSSTLKTAPFTFAFDGAFDECSSQEKFYNQSIRPLAQGLLIGKPATVICFGPGESGKTYTLKGKQGADRGCMIRTVEELFNLIDLAKEGKSPSSSNIEITLSMYALYQNKICDLLEHSNTTLKTLDIANEGSGKVIKNLSAHALKGTYDCQSYFQRAEKTRKILAMEEQDPEFHQRSHTVVLLTLYKPSRSEKKMLSRVQFVELANSEQAVDKAKPKVAKTIAANFNSFSVKVLNHALGKDTMDKDKLGKCIDLSMEVGSKVVFICCVAPGVDKLKHTLPALKFSAKIMECIEGKLSFKEPSKEETEEEESYEAPSVHTKEEEDIKSTPTLKRNDQAAEAQKYFEESLKKVKDEVQELEREHLNTERHYHNLSTVPLRAPQQTERLKRTRTEFYDRKDYSPKSPERAEEMPRETFSKPWKTVYDSRGERESPVEERVSELENPKRSLAERKIPGIGLKQHSVTLSRDAESIVNKYSKISKVEESSPKQLPSATLEYEEKLNSIEKRSKSISKTLKKLATARNESSSALAQQYESLFAETKALYGKMIDGLNQKNSSLEAKLMSKRDDFRKKDFEATEAKKIALKKLEAKDMEIEELQDRLREYEEGTKRMAQEMEETHSLNKTALKKIDELSNNQETLIREGELRGKKENEALKNQVFELKAKLKEKNETLAKLQNTHSNDTKEVAELKYKLAAEVQVSEEAQEQIKKLQKKLEEIQGKFVEAEKKASKASKKLAKIKEEHDEKYRNEKGKIKDLEDALDNAEEKVEQLSKELRATKEEKMMIKKEKEEVEKKLEETTSELNRIKEEAEEAKDSLSMTRTESQKRNLILENTVQDLELKLKTKDTRIADLEEKTAELERKLKVETQENEKKTQLIKEFEQNLTEVKKTNKQLSEENTKLVSDLEAVQYQNEEKLIELEKACDIIKEEYEVMKEEKDGYKRRIEETEEKARILTKEKEKYVEKYKNVKKTNKSLRDKLEDIENEIQHYAKEKEMEIREAMRREEAKKTREQSKLMVLQEVQNHISHFKHEQMMRKSPKRSPMKSYRKSPLAQFILTILIQQSTFHYYY
eukprot:TRINITY_DN2313_c1_g1_i1.p1 TRINITY_DN2313_c1_g1~~TRINITY_DN2313_c1_g1_i1.p1  ORF type:complete len:1204 (+),score=229.26 TRINITY_DN2313_c1_g1_i1:7428-11039(+)